MQSGVISEVCPVRGWRVLRSFSVATALAAVLLASLIGCRRPAQESDPPLRPLLFTETPGGDRIVASPEGSDPVAFPSEFSTSAPAPPADAGYPPATSPEHLLQYSVAALLTNNTTVFRRYTYDAASLALNARMSLPAARDAEEILTRDVSATFDLFDPGPESAQRPGALSAQLEPTQITVGSPHLLDGSKPHAGDDPVMYWGSEVELHVKSTPAVTFTLRFPKILRDS